MQKNNLKGASPHLQSFCSVWGVNNYGQISNDNTSIIQVPTLVKCQFAIFNAAFGDFHSIYLDESLHIYSSGANMYGQLGFRTNDDSNKDFNTIPLLSNKKFEMISCGSCHSYALTTEGKIYCWGLNFKGQLGTGKIENIYEPYSLETDVLEKGRKINQIQTKVSRNLAIAPKNTFNDDSEKNLFVIKRPLSTERKLTTKSVDLKQFSREENLIKLFTLLPSESVSEVACGALHTLIRTSNKRIFSTGFNECYALGTNDNISSKIFREIVFFTQANLKCAKIACGINMSGCITSEGNIYEWGLIGKVENLFQILKSPTLIPLEPLSTSKHFFKKKIKNIYAIDLKIGDGFTLILTENGEIYSWGINTQGQLGLGNTNFIREASKIMTLSQEITQISCGLSHSSALTKNNQVYIWGNNNFSQLGMKKIKSLNSPTLHKAFENSVPYKIVCGPNCTMCLSYKAPFLNSGDIVENKEEIKTMKKEKEAKLSTNSLLHNENNSEADVERIQLNSFFEINHKDLVFKEKITEGGYGIVYYGKWHETPVAIKEIKEEFVTEEKLEEFLTECTIMEIARHPNIVLFLGACTKPPKICIILEFCEMGSLWTLLHFTKTELPWKLRKQIAIDIARGINYLHSFKTPLLHRDLKSLNILLDSNLTAKLADFGWARLKESIMTGKIGTYQWMAPEVICSKQYTEKADVYSYGVILWEIAIRQPPYYGMDVKEVANKVVNQNYRPPIKDSDAPQAFINIMKKCWHKDPNQRPTFTKIIQTLEKMEDFE